MFFKFQSVRFKCALAVFIILISVSLFSLADSRPLVKKIKQIENELDARVGVSIYDAGNQKSWDYKGDLRFPLMSTFKSLACAKLLADVDGGHISLQSSIVIKQSSLVTYSPVTQNYVDKEFTLYQACSAAMLMSDNTAANIVLESINGPKGLTAFMRKIGDQVTSLDRIEPALNEALPGDLRDSTSPNAINHSLHKLLFGNELSEQSKKQLKQWMTANKVADNLLRSVLPGSWQIADRSGAGGNGSRGITAVVWQDKQAPFLISIYITQTDASFALRNKAIVEIGNEIFNTLQN
ncbi:class A beta-lactamase [Psychromonas ossibalaenae]|uniref:class A beta-lactamase n=1 Tax=Psychromonas ossibalaenae TaxID=444922 RepID=UPI00036B7459|nr:class A beta-lactamase [Psychromonas ossibalaenae]